MAAVDIVRNLAAVECEGVALGEVEGEGFKVRVKRVKLFHGLCIMYVHACMHRSCSQTKLFEGVRS